MKILSNFLNILKEYKILSIIGAVLLITSPIIWRILPHLSFLMLFLTFSGMCCIIYAILLHFERSSIKSLSVISKALRITAIILIAIFIISMTFIQIKIFSGMKQKEQKCEYIIVLGCGLRGDAPSLSLKYRLDKAIEYMEKYPDSKAVLCGGQGNGEIVTEAYAMNKYLLSNGIAPSRILLEEESKDTTQNIKFAKSIIEERCDAENTPIAIVSNDFHIYRTMLIAKKQSLNNVCGLSAKTPKIPFLKLNCHLREYFSVIFEYLGI